MTCIMEASFWGKTEILKKLLKAKPDLSLKDQNGQSRFIFSMSFRISKLVEFSVSVLTTTLSEGTSESILALIIF